MGPLTKVLSAVSILLVLGLTPGHARSTHHLTKNTDSTTSIETPPLPVSEDGAAARQKRTVVFRPLFVYREQQIKKTRVHEENRRQGQHTQTQPETQNHHNSLPHQQPCHHYPQSY